MQERNHIKMILDIVLTILFIALLYARDTGFTFHEIAGLIMGGLLIYHIILNWSWIKSITKNLFNPRLKAKPRFFYLLNVVSLLAVAAIIITGVQISMVLFPSDEMISHTLVDVHKWASYTCIGLFGLHIALHWQFIARTVPKLFKASARPVWGRAGLSMAAILLILSLVYTQIYALSKDAASEDGVSYDKSTLESLPQNEAFYTDRPRHGHGHGWEQSGDVCYDGNAPRYSARDESSVPDSGVSLIQPDQNSATSNNSSINPGSNGDKPSLDNYLSNLFCNACEKHCSLLSLRCDRGIAQLEAARQQYQTLYVTQ